jgi:hypothetical protein
MDHDAHNVNNHTEVGGHDEPTAALQLPSHRSRKPRLPLILAIVAGVLVVSG